MGLERDEEIYTGKNAKQHLTTEQQKNMEYKYPQQRTQSEQQILKTSTSTETQDADTRHVQTVAKLKQS